MLIKNLLIKLNLGISRLLLYSVLVAEWLDNNSISSDTKFTIEYLAPSVFIAPLLPLVFVLLVVAVDGDAVSPVVSSFFLFVNSNVNC